MDGVGNVIELLGRILLASIFLLSGVNKIMTYEVTQAYMETMNVSGCLLGPVIVLEIAGALGLILGWWTRLAALGLAVFTILAAFLFHGDFDNQMQMIMFMKNITITGGLLLLLANGSGEISIDQR
ncbi:MAG TPA: DoxX family protein [Pseudomonadales bacterium]